MTTSTKLEAMVTEANALYKEYQRLVDVSDAALAEAKRMSIEEAEKGLGVTRSNVAMAAWQEYETASMAMFNAKKVAREAWSAASLHHDDLASGGQ